MSFPANAIGLGAAAVAGGYYGGAKCSGLSPFDYLILAVLLAVAVYFGLILS